MDVNLAARLLEADRLITKLKEDVYELIVKDPSINATDAIKRIVETQVTTPTRKRIEASVDKSVMFFELDDDEFPEGERRAVQVYGGVNEDETEME